MKKYIIIFLIIIIILITALIFILSNKHQKEEKPTLTLKGQKNITLTIGEEYKEEGYQASIGSKDLTAKVKITNEVNYNQKGVYKITYSLKYNNLKLIEERIVKIKEQISYKDEYDKIDNTSRGWWSTNQKDGTRPSGGADINELKKYNAYYMGPNKKVIYLTFDEGSNETYLKEIVDVLDKNNVKATFFLCDKYMQDNKELIKQMAENGHSIGNHTDNHKNMPSLATKENFAQYLSEIQTVEKTFYNITGKQMDKVYRDPRGEWSYRDLQIIKDLGYKTFFYSAYYYDYAEDVTKEHALNELLKRHHNGAIYLIHPKNKGNYLALDSLIKELKKLGYSFDLVKNINEQK